MSTILSIMISAVVSFLVAYVTAKRCFDKIDGYVKDVTEELYGALNALTSRFGEDQKSK